MAETLRFNKGDRARRKPKEIEETKPSEPQNRFSITDFNNQSKNQRSEDTKPKRGKGRPRKNKSTKSIRISDEAVDIINAYKQITDQETQDDAVIDIAPYLLLIAVYKTSDFKGTTIVHSYFIIESVS